MDEETKLFLSYFYIVLVGVLIFFALFYLALELADCYRRRRSHAAAARILGSVPDDVPYLPLPDDGDQQAASNSPSSCVICMAEYARGEGRFVMPGCVHAFHRGCIAEWLRQGNTTCPICRGTAIVAAVVVGPPPPAAAGEEDAVVVAGVGVSTAEDMV